VSLITEFKAGKLKVNIYENRISMGAAAADDVAGIINELLKVKPEVRMVFAAAPSQKDFFDALVQKNIDWSKVVAFHMDEYVGFEAGSENLFGNYLKKNIFDRVDFKKVNFIETYNGDIKAECERYSKLLSEAPIDIVGMGIGENGHVAFNDPYIADFNDPKLVKVIEIDKESRQQQVNDGCFANFDEVPQKAVTLSVPALLSSTHKIVVVPGKLKANAVSKTIYHEVSNSCPSTILRSTDNTTLYLDMDSAQSLTLEE